MASFVEKIKKSKTDLLLVFLLVALSVPLRFVNLGYSDYIGDEHKSFISPLPGQSTWDFFMTRRKGPMQFFVSQIPYLITGDYRNELAQRIPYASISVLAIVVFYALIKKFSGNKLIAFCAAFLTTVNGFIVGFGRIAQYQNLNLLFSFLALYFYLDLLGDTKNKLKASGLGTLFYALSLLSHWDAVFILPMIIYIWISYFLKSESTKQVKLKLVLHNFLLGCLLLLPFLIPYSLYQVSHEENTQYFARRVEIGHSNLERYKLLFELYNPFLTFWFVLATFVIGLVKFKKNKAIFVWFLFGIVIFEVFVRKPGTHIYNFIIPILIISSYGIAFVLEKLPTVFKVLAAGIVLVVFSFLYYQSYLIFVDHSAEYPWEQKKVLVLNHPKNKVIFEGKKVPENLLYWKTPKYNIDQKLPLFGFPHYRNWNEINEFVNTYNSEDKNEYGYMTNEVKTISEWYMDAKYLSDDKFFVVAVKRPLSFVKDWKFGDIKNKTTVHKIFNEEGSTVVRVYEVIHENEN